MIIRAGIIALLVIANSLLSAQSPVGFWKTVDDNTGDTRSEMELYINADGKLEGKIHKLLDADAPETCDLCPGDKKDAKLIGMVIMWDLQEDGLEWEKGRIMDPENGKVYKCYIELQKNDAGKYDTLKVRGYIGISALGRTQYWYRK